MRKYHLSIALALSLFAAACAKESTTADQAKVLTGAFTKINTIRSSDSELRQVREQVRKAHKQAQGQALLARFAGEAGVSMTAGCTGTPLVDGQIDCCVSVEGTNFSMSCTTLQDDTLTCGSTTYTMKQGGTFEMTGSTTGTGMDDMSFNFGMDMNMTIAGGAFGDEGSAFDCNWSFSFTAAQMSEMGSDTGAALDCDSLEFSCTIGGTAISCQDLKTSMTENTETCS